MELIKKIKNITEAVAEKIRWLPPLTARLSVGIVFVQAGWGKLHNLEQVTEFFTQLGIPAAHLQAPFVAAVEFVGGLMLLIGLGTRLASVLLIGTMVVAILTAKLSELAVWTDLFGFSEYLYILLLGWLVVEGAGAVSADAACCKGSCAKGEGSCS